MSGSLSIGNRLIASSIAIVSMAALVAGLEVQNHALSGQKRIRSVNDRFRTAIDRSLSSAHRVALRVRRLRVDDICDRVEPCSVTLKLELDRRLTKFERQAPRNNFFRILLPPATNE